MNRLDIIFNKLRSESRKALIPFVTAGHPHPLMTVPIMHALVKNGANIIELGMPFSDPMADGVVIQKSSEKAIEHGMTLSSVLDIVSEFREQDQYTPVVLMGYLNPIEKFGYDAFVAKASRCGIDGLLIVDAPPEGSDQLRPLLKDNHISQIFLISPTTDDQRKKYILSLSSGFVYCVALKGVTGSSQVEYGHLAEQMAIVKKLTDLPTAVGFGVSDVTSAQAVAQYADAVVIGSALVKQLDKCANQSECEHVITEFIKPIADAINE